MAAVFTSLGGDRLPSANPADGEPPLFSASRRRAFGAATCFLCARRLNKDNRTDEHVVPQWVQSRYGLWQQKITLLNGSHFKYGNLKIPCCNRCNCTHLQRIEKRVCAAFDAGSTEVSKLDLWDLHIWLGKIFYGILYKELFLRKNIRKPAGRMITDRRLLRQMNLLHFSLQGARYRIAASAVEPEIAFPLSSLFIFESKVPAPKEAQFDLRDSLNLMVINLRIGNVAVIGCLQDGGATRVALDPLVMKLRGRTLHPFQLLELYARILYHATLFDRVPKWFISEEQGEVRMVQASLQGLSSKPVFRPWNADDYANVLSAVTAVPRNVIRPSETALMTWLFDANDSFVDLDFTKQPWPPV